MKRRRTLAVLLLSATLFAVAPALAAPKKVLFDNTKGETAGNADWIIDTDQPLPVPAQSTVTAATPRTYWLGGISSWGIDLVKRGFEVATLTSAYGITYGNAGNLYDLSKYDVFVLPEPNSPFTTAESTAIFNFVRDGGGLIAVVDHHVSDRNGDGWDSPMVMNDLDALKLWGVHSGTAGDANNNIVQTSTNVNPSLSDSIIRGPVGTVTGLAFHNGTTFTLYPALNPTVRGEVWMNGVAQTSNASLMAASSVYGNGRVVYVGDSSPIDDGSAQPGNSSIYDGWGEAGATDSTLMMNATYWAARRDPPAGDTQAPVVDLTAPNGGEVWKVGAARSITWSATDNVGVTVVDIDWSPTGGAPWTALTSGSNTGLFAWVIPNSATASARVRVRARDAIGNLGSDSSSAVFTIDHWTITASAGAGGTITPSGVVNLAQGGSQTFTIAPDAGHHIVDVLVNGASVGPVSSRTFTSVFTHQTIAATFADATAPVVALISPTGGERWDFGQTRTLRWNASDDAGVDSVRVEVSYHGAGGPWTELLASGSAVDSLDWTVPTIATDSALVRVIAFDVALNAGSATSDSLFHLVDPLAAVEDGPMALAFARPTPNPSRGTVRFAFALPEPAGVTLDVLDVTGRRVATLAHGAHPAGAHALHWSGRDATGAPVRAGVYFARLVTSGRTMTHRFVRMD